MKSFQVLIIVLVAIVTTYGQEQRFQTLNYFKNDSTKLDLDLFLPNHVNEATPLVIFIHGGGFSGGNRQAGHQLCSYLSANGVAAATITYTLYMKESDQSFSCDGILTEKIKAIQIAANQTWQATQYLIENSKQCNINTKQIFIAGSSAGAETIYGAAYWKPEVMGMYPLQLPADFKYAGFISGGGAMVDINLITNKNMLPSLLFHGTCDNVVPYNIAPHHYCEGNVPGWLMLFGDYAVHERICKLNGSTSMVSYCGGNHDYASYPFSEEHLRILSFIRTVLAGEKFQSHTIVQTQNTCELSKEYNFCN